MKIIGFGCAVPASMACRDGVGTMPFMAPELLVGDSHASQRVALFTHTGSYYI